MTRSIRRIDRPDSVAVLTEKGGGPHGKIGEGTKCSGKDGGRKEEVGDGMGAEKGRKLGEWIF